MVTPTKDEILKRARVIAHERQFKAGLPAITPEDYELKESGDFYKARIELMSTSPTQAPSVSDQQVHAQMRRYVDDMAKEMGLVVYARKYVKELEKAQKRLETMQRKKPSNANSILYLAHAMKWPKMTKVSCPYCDEKVQLSERGLIPMPHMVSHKKIGGKWVSTTPKPKVDVLKSIPKMPSKYKRYERAIKPTISVRDEALMLRAIHEIGTKARKQRKKKRHVQRSGKVMRKLRKRVKDGQKVFSFPDNVWKVRK